MGTTRKLQAVIISGQSDPVEVTGSITGTFTLAGLEPLDQAYLDYSDDAVGAVYVEVVTATSGACQRIYVYDSGGYPLVIGVGAAGVEVDQFYIGPGFGGFFDVTVPTGSRIAIKSLLAATTISEGYFILSTFG